MKKIIGDKIYRYDAIVEVVNVLGKTDEARRVAEAIAYNVRSTTPRITALGDRLSDAIDGLDEYVDIVIAVAFKTLTRRKHFRRWWRK